MNDWILLLSFLAPSVAGESHKTLFVLFIFIFSCLHYSWKQSQGWLQMKSLCLEKEHFVPEPHWHSPAKQTYSQGRVKQGKNWKERKPNRCSPFNLINFWKRSTEVIISTWFASSSRLVSGSSPIWVSRDCHIWHFEKESLSKSRLTWPTRDHTA